MSAWLLTRYLRAEWGSAIDEASKIDTTGYRVLSYETNGVVLYCTTTVNVPRAITTRPSLRPLREKQTGDFSHFPEYAPATVPDGNVLVS